MDRLMERLHTLRACKTLKTKGKRRLPSNCDAENVRRSNSAAVSYCSLFACRYCADRRAATDAPFSTPLRRTRDELSVSTLDLFRRATGTTTTSRDKGLYAQIMSNLERGGKWQFAKEWAETGGPQRVVAVDCVDAFLCDVRALLGDTIEREHLDIYRHGTEFARLFATESVTPIVDDEASAVEDGIDTTLVSSSNSNLINGLPDDARVVTVGTDNVPITGSHPSAASPMPCNSMTTETPHASTKPSISCSTVDAGYIQGESECLSISCGLEPHSIADDKGVDKNDNSHGKQCATGDSSAAKHQETHPHGTITGLHASNLPVQSSSTLSFVVNDGQDDSMTANTSGRTLSVPDETRDQIVPCDARSVCPSTSQQLGLLSSVVINEHDSARSTPTVPLFELDLNDPPPPVPLSRDEEAHAVSPSLVNRVDPATRGVYDWTVADVGNWVIMCDGGRLAQYRDIFVENCITGRDLLDLIRLDVAGLGQMGIGPMGHRLTLLRCIANLMDCAITPDQAPALPPTTADTDASKQTRTMLSGHDDYVLDAFPHSVPDLQDADHPRHAPMLERSPKCGYRNCTRPSASGITRCQQHRESQNEYARRSRARQKKGRRPTRAASQTSNQTTMRYSTERAHTPPREPRSVELAPEKADRHGVASDVLVGNICAPSVRADDDRFKSQCQPDRVTNVLSAQCAGGSIGGPTDVGLSALMSPVPLENGDALAPRCSIPRDTGLTDDTLESSKNADRANSIKRRRDSQQDTDDQETKDEGEKPTNWDSGPRSPIEVDYPPMTAKDLLALRPEKQHRQIKRRAIDHDGNADDNGWHVQHNAPSF
ncbi:SAM domain containing protein [Pandoravirus macleodensis]|uniref:SAM domain containing protein n=1 Tax=Pandoravirus macleodensis TaxID=2107707 RepID=A0A2U7UFQ0_9VIRU|nr:SAM domain containing protein [Pandoravirus macleodensis]AVK77242.1 SAM domain containing protein [Pandoravirus macleodensis]